MDLNTAPPVEFDTALAAKYDELGTALVAADRAWSTVTHHAKEFTGRTSYRDKMTHDEVTAAADEAQALAAQPDPGYDDNAVWRRWYGAGKVAKAVATYTAAHAVVVGIRETIGEFNAAFTARGGWTRAYLVTNANGHVHKSMDCSTCFEPRYDQYGAYKPGTQYAWLPELSDHDEAEIIAAAGSDACTVCYPNAPVDAPPRSVFTADERTAAQKRQDAAAAKDKRRQDRIAKGLTADGSEFQVTYNEMGSQYVQRADGTTVLEPALRTRRESFKTERAAVQWVVQYKAWGRYENEKGPAFQQVIEAVAAKHGRTVEDVTAEIDAKVAAKIKRDSR